MVDARRVVVSAKDDGFDVWAPSALVDRQAGEYVPSHPVVMPGAPQIDNTKACSLDHLIRRRLHACLLGIAKQSDMRQGCYPATASRQRDCSREPDGRPFVSL